jgi:RND family efflux transporter MFP subunit
MKRAWLIAGVVGLAFLGWFGIRVRDAMQTQKALAAEREQQAKSAETTPKEKSTGKPHTVAPVAEKWRPLIGLEGTLQPAREAELGFKVPGRLGAIRVKLGDRVHTGETLAMLEDNEARAQVQAAEAQVHAAEAQLALAEDSSRRLGALASRGAGTEMSGVQSSQQKNLADAQLEGARAQLQLAQANLKNQALLAPFSGSVTKVPSGTGAIVNPGAPLFHVSDVSTLKLAATVSEGDVGLVKTGASVELTLDGKKIEGKVSAVLSSVDSATRRVPVEAQLTNDGQLLGGSFVRAQIVGLSEVPVLRLPANTLRPGSQNEVMVVRAGRLERRHVTFSTDGSTILVRAGLAANERVLVAPSAEAQDGDPAGVDE